RRDYDGDGHKLACIRCFRVSMPRQVDDVNAMTLRERVNDRHEEAAMHRESMQQHERRAFADAFDVQRHDTHSASASSSRSMSSSVCAADSDTRKRAVPAGTVGGGGGGAPKTR